MIALSLPEILLIALRWVLLLGPLLLTLAMARYRGLSERAQIAGLFAFLYGAAMVFVCHSFAVWIGWWQYGWDALMLNGLPADIMIGGAVLFGPALYFSFPDTRPLMICLPIIFGLHGTIFSSLEPLVFAGPNWFLGVVFVFAVAHLPAIYLAKWTEQNTHLGFRCALLAIMTGGMLFAVLPSLIMQAMGGHWDIFDKATWAICATLFLLVIVSVVGVGANQTLCLQGQGTPIPLDPTKRLVTTGIYAYVSNPMQLSAALGCIVLGAFLQNIWVMSASVMAWVFVQGMVRWHHRNDLLRRFPEGWPTYKEHVPEWLPRWTPWVPQQAMLALNPELVTHRLLGAFLREAAGLQIVWNKRKAARYENPMNIYQFKGTSALATGLLHKNFVVALAAHAWLLLSVPLMEETVLAEGDLK